MDTPNKTTEIARTYLKQLGSTQEKIHKPEVRAWLELEERLMLGLEQKRPKAAQPPLRPQTPINNKRPKETQSIWKRPISELWR